MKNKLIILILGAMFILSLQFCFASDDYKTTDYFGELEPRDYGEMEMDTPSKITFKESEGVYGSHVFYNKDYMCVYIYFKDKCDENYGYNHHTLEAKVIYPDKASNNDFSGKVTFYKEKNSPYLCNYIAAYENEDYVIIIRYDYIDDLVDMVRSIEINY